MKSITDRCAHAPGRAKPKSRRSMPDPSIGDIFGEWTVDGPLIQTGSHRMVRCRCSCGVRYYVRVDALVYGHSIRCRGCANAVGRSKMLGQYAPKRMGMLPPKKPTVRDE